MCCFCCDALGLCPPDSLSHTPSLGLPLSDSLPRTNTLGGNGELISGLVSAVNAFTARHNELIVLTFSHDLDTDGSYSPLNQAQWDQLLNTHLLTIQNRFVADTSMLTDLGLDLDQDLDLTQLPLEVLLDGGQRSAVLVVVEPGDRSVQLPPLSAGIYPSCCLPRFDRWVLQWLGMTGW